MKESLKTISFIGATASISLGAILLTKGLQAHGMFWLIVAGTVMIFSGILNIVVVGTGIFDALELLLCKTVKAFDKKIQ